MIHYLFIRSDSKGLYEYWAPNGVLLRSMVARLFKTLKILYG